LVLLLLACSVTFGASPSFVISGNKFLKDGARFQILSGSFHYFRVHPAYWNSTFHNMRYIGLNVAQTYIPWNLHEPTPGTYVWDGFADIIQYLELAKANDMLVVLRMGPYICAEWEYGGFPFWLMQLYPTIKPRTSDPNFLKRTDMWWAQLLPKLKPYLYSNGGPIIL
jgi:beta-galactosidase